MFGVVMSPPLFSYFYGRWQMDPYTEGMYTDKGYISQIQGDYVHSGT